MAVKRRDWDTNERRRFTDPGEFFMLKNDILDTWGPIIGVVGLAVYVLVARRYRLGSPDHPPKVFYRSVREMGKNLNVTPKTIGRYLQALEEHGLIERVNGCTTHKQAVGYRPVLPVPNPPTETVVTGNTVTSEPKS